MKASRVIGWLVERRLVLAVGLLAALPVIVGTVNALQAGWTPVFDDGIVATNAYDAFTSHGSLVGVYSEASLPQVGPVYNAGPLLLWLLAIPTRLFGDWALPVLACLISTASILCVVALARRRGGVPFMFATALALLVMCRSFPPEAFHDILNASIGLLPFTLLLFLAWSAGCGEYRLLPATVLVGSFVLQSHASLAVPAVAVLAVGLGWPAIEAFASRRRDEERPDGRRRWVLGAVGVAVACWTATVIDQLVHSPGNVSRLVDTATSGEKRLGLEIGWHAVVKSTGLLPWWTTRPQPGSIRFSGLFDAPAAVTTLSSVVMLGGLVLAGTLGARRGRRDVTVVAVLALAVSAAVTYGVSSTPVRFAIFAAKATQGAQITGMFVALGLGWAVVELGRSAGWSPVARLERLARLAPPRMAVLSVLIVTSGVSILASGNLGPDSMQSLYRPVRAIASRLDGRVPRGGTISMVSTDPLVVRAFALTAGIAYQLRVRGYHPVIAESTSFVAKLGSYYSRERHPARTQMIIDDREAPSQPGARLVATAPPSTVPHPAFPPRPATVSVRTLPVCPPPSPAAKPPARRVRNLHPAGPWLRGFIDHSAIVNDRVELCGWMVSTDARRLPREVALFADGRFVGAAKPSISRPDVVRAFHAAGGPKVGFSLDAPAWLLPRGSGSRIEAFAVAGGDAAPIPLGCEPGTRDLGC